MPKRQNDDYYTKPEVACRCADLIRTYVHHRSRKVVLEPSAGSGVFLKYIRGTDDTVAIDIAPAAPGIIKGDFLESDYRSLGLPIDRSTVTVVGNPPFGTNSSLAIKFFNKSTEMADTIAFILPKTFRKRSVHKKLDPHFHMVYDEDLPKNSFLLDGNTYDVTCCFQIWTHDRRPRPKKPLPRNDWLEFVSKTDNPDFAIRRVGGRAGQVLDGFDHKEPSTYFVKEKKPGVKEALQKIDFSKSAFHTAGMGSVSKEEILLALGEYFETNPPEDEDDFFEEINFFEDFSL